MTYGDRGFPNGSVGKEYTSNAGDTGDTVSVPGLGRSPGGGNATHSSILTGKSMDREHWWATVRGVTESDMTE